MHDRIIGALETCCRQGEMLRIQNRDVEWTQHQILIKAEEGKDNENRRIPFDPKGRLAPILKRRAELGPYAFRLAREGEFQDSFKTAWAGCSIRTPTVFSETPCRRLSAPPFCARVQRLSCCSRSRQIARVGCISTHASWYWAMFRCAHRAATSVMVGNSLIEHHSFHRCRTSRQHSAICKDEPHSTTMPSSTN